MEDRLVPLWTLSCAHTPYKTMDSCVAPNEPVLQYLVLYVKTLISVKARGSCPVSVRYIRRRKVAQPLLLMFTEPSYHCSPRVACAAAVVSLPLIPVQQISPRYWASGRTYGPHFCAVRVSCQSTFFRVWDSYNARLPPLPRKAGPEATCAPCSQQGDVCKRSRLPCLALTQSGLPCNMPLAPRNALVGGVCRVRKDGSTDTAFFFPGNALDLLRPLLI